MASAPWQDIAKRKQAERDALLPKEWRLLNASNIDAWSVADIPRKCGILSSEEIDITENYDATALAEAIRNKKFTCVQVTIAYCKRATIAQDLINCLTEILFDRALQRAMFLDHHLARYGKPIGPFHGVPISIKDCFKITGVDASIGIASLCFNPAKETAHMVDLLTSAGAVIYCKTNVPQTMAALDSVNNVFGRTLNPLNRLVTAGGSSGGEGALVGIKGSPLGVGTDVGGSIRIPAMCNGLYGIKPSAHRTPYSGQESGGPPGYGGGLVASAGPIARSMRDCELMLRTIADSQPWLRDPLLMPGKWDSSSLDVLGGSSPPQKTLNIGVLSTDGLVTPLPPIATLLREVSNTLEKSPNINIYYLPTPPSLATAQALANKLMSFEGANGLMDNINKTGEPMIPWLRGRFGKRPPTKLPEVLAINAQAEKLRIDLLKRLWWSPDGRNVELDAIICPVSPHPTPKIDHFGGVGYTIDWVMTDYPAGVIPVREMSEQDLEVDVPAENLKYPLGGLDKLTQGLWGKTKEDRKHYLGTWLCIQVLAPRLQERRLCRAMDAIDRVLKQASGQTQARL